MMEIPMLNWEHLKYASIRAIVNTSLYVRRSRWLAPSTQPDLIKTHGNRRYLFASRIFIPQGLDSQETLPLVIRAHGGGFVVNNPALDDPIARYLADNARCVVASIDYGKAPQHKFPGGYEDVIAQSLAVIDDQELPLDRSKVVLCGSSAGGSLVLGAAQDARLRSKVIGVAGIYPLVDVATDAASKMATRPDPSIPDFIGDSYDGIAQLYLDDDQSRTDKRLSPTYFASRDSLPPDVLLLGAEHDMFCYEAEVMADKLVSSSDVVSKTSSSGWRAPGVQWHKIMGQPHGFDAFPIKDAVKEEARKAAVDELYSTVSDWLVGIFRTKSDG